ncbi:universal stress protein [Virgibacillus kekensis]|uniref:Universal stress protein n=1 Tax=Virgibacillus kekensis TaxID=202261 RepID=A0ABV9DPR7_9BACI
MYKKILLASDGSEHAKRAAENAVNLAKLSSGAQLEIVFVVDPSKAKSDVLNNWNTVDINDERYSRFREVKELAKQAEVSYEVKILHGEPGPTIVHHANNNDFDVVVIGSRGLNVLQEFVLGSVSHKVAKRAKCPVLIVK